MPISKPTESPMMAPRITTISTTVSEVWPRLAVTPPMIASVSPGSTNPTKSASSANTTAATIT